MKTATTTVPGYTNRNGQRVIRATLQPGIYQPQRLYVLYCEDCATEYLAKGAAIYHRRCPICQFGSTADAPE